MVFYQLSQAVQEKMLRGEIMFEVGERKMNVKVQHGAKWKKNLKTIHLE